MILLKNRRRKEKYRKKRITEERERQRMKSIDYFGERTLHLIHESRTHWTTMRIYHHIDRLATIS